MLANILSTKSKEVAIILTVETVGFLAHTDYKGERWKYISTVSRA